MGGNNMSDIVKSAENNEVILKIIRDSDSFETPRDWDNLGHMICWHNRYNLGDKHNYSDPRSFLEYIAEDYIECHDNIESMDDERLMDVIKENAVVLPLYLYDHSGITMNTVGFSSRWDSGQVGWIYVTHDEITQEYGVLNEDNIRKAKDVLESEVKTYDQYLTGDIYGYTLERKVDCDSCGRIELKDIDSCWGFYGLDYLEEELRHMYNEKFNGLVDNLRWAY